MHLVEVTDKRTRKLFLEISIIINKSDPNWVCPLDSHVESIFDPEKNDNFKNGKAKRWILQNAEGALIGRIAAFYNLDKANRYNPPTGGVGFFECINDQKAANLLFDISREWLESEGMGAMDGPVNFGENDTYWGLLVEGFTPPAFGMNYNPPYYKALFENYGFKPFFEQESKHLDLTTPFPERFWKIAKWVISKNLYTFEHFSKKNMLKYAADVVSIHNEAWVHHEHFAPLTTEKVMKVLEDSKAFLIEDFIWFVYHEKKPIGFLVMLPDINQILKPFKGKMNFWNKLLFLIQIKGKKINRSRITILGVVPKYQGKGVESAIFWQLRNPLEVKRPHYKEIEISWVGDFNPKMKSTLEAMKAGPGKIHITYRKSFKEEHFKKATPIPELRAKD
jgi:hypothetical protein